MLTCGGGDEKCQASTARLAVPFRNKNCCSRAMLLCGFEKQQKVALHCSKPTQLSAAINGRQCADQQRYLRYIPKYKKTLSSENKRYGTGNAPSPDAMYVLRVSAVYP